MTTLEKLDEMNAVICDEILYLENQIKELSNRLHSLRTVCAYALTLAVCELREKEAEEKRNE